MSAIEYNTEKLCIVNKDIVSKIDKTYKILSSIFLQF